MAFLTIICLFASSRPLRAQESDISDQQAKIAWKKGLQLFKTNRYQEAQVQFAQGYAFSHNAAFLFNMAECARMIKDNKQAYQLYRRYLSEHPKSKLRAKAVQRCQELEMGECIPPAQSSSKPKIGASPIPLDNKKRSDRPEQIRPGTQTTSTKIEDYTSSPEPAPKPYLPISSRADNYPPKEDKPLHKKWIFWAGIGAVVVAGSVTAAILATQGESRSIPGGFNSKVDLQSDFGD
jgi:hypothetical protein